MPELAVVCLLTPCFSGNLLDFFTGEKIRKSGSRPQAGAFLRLIFSNTRLARNVNAKSSRHHGRT
jgi:hypothetical protein